MCLQFFLPFTSIYFIYVLMLKDASWIYVICGDMWTRYVDLVYLCCWMLEFPLQNKYSVYHIMLFIIKKRDLITVFFKRKARKEQRKLKKIHNETSEFLKPNDKNELISPPSHTFNSLACALPVCSQACFLGFECAMKFLNWLAPDL